MISISGTKKIKEPSSSERKLNINDLFRFFVSLKGKAPIKMVMAIKRKMFVCVCVFLVWVVFVCFFFIKKSLKNNIRLKIMRNVAKTEVGIFVKEIWKIRIPCHSTECDD